MLEIKNTYTRKIDREYSELVLDGSTVTVDKKGNNTYSLSSGQGKADDYLVIAMTGCSQDELDNLSIEEFDAILEKVNKMRQSGSDSK